MKHLKIVILAAFTLSVSLVITPECTAERLDEKPAIKAAAAYNANDPGMLLPPSYNCDPKMLIPGNPEIDPKFLLKYLP